MATINWRSRRVIGVIVATLMVLVTGIIAEIASVEEAGSSVATSQRYAAVGKVADGSTPGSTRTSSACPPAGQQTLSSGRPGATKELVPSGANSVTLCRYLGANPAADQAVFQLIGIGAVEDSGTTGGIAQALNAIKQLHGNAISCPMDDGSAITAIFHYRSGVDDPVRIGTKGCNTVTNGHVQRLALGGSILGEIEGFIRPVKTQVATFRGHVRGCGGVAPGSCHAIKSPTICTPKCHRATRVAAYDASGRVLGMSGLHHGRFHFNVAAAGSYTLKLFATDQVLTTVTAKAQLKHTTPVVFTMQLK